MRGLYANVVESLMDVYYGVSDVILGESYGDYVSHV